ncbi:Spermatogenesis-associated protein 17 [Myotis davidii]|uniref:Spermatogenesis-associated protein 17 n=1 Tax=Myotis davidii TaxID=225400 RepID=L5M379_MYODS|nr:Spermatogenesis-associated protein 17 [Myotis davidii]
MEAETGSRKQPLVLSPPSPRCLPHLESPAFTHRGNANTILSYSKYTVFFSNILETNRVGENGVNQSWTPLDLPDGLTRLPWRPVATSVGKPTPEAMASLARLQARSALLGHQYYFRNSVVDAFRKKENEAAVKIQSWFRGCQVRTYIREALDDFADMREREEKKADLEREEKKRDYAARKMHYLLSTKQIPGVYNSPFRKEPDPWELRLQKAKPLTPQRPKARQKRPHSLSSWLACTSTRSFPRSHTLPPIDRKQCQGPFRDVSDVLKQRYKPLEPTMRVAEPINTLTEARSEFKRLELSRNVQENMFLPFSSYHKKERYVPSIHSSSKYGPDAYGYHRFRDESPNKWIGGKKWVRTAAAAPIAPQEQREVEKPSDVMRSGSCHSHPLMAPSDWDRHQQWVRAVAPALTAGASRADTSSRCECQGRTGVRGSKEFSVSTRGSS